MKIRTPSSPCRDNTLFRGHFYGFLRFVVWPNRGQLCGVYQSHYCASEGVLFFFFRLCNVSKYCFLFVLKVVNKLYLHCMNGFHLCKILVSALP